MQAYFTPIWFEREKRNNSREQITVKHFPFYREKKVYAGLISWFPRKIPFFSIPKRKKKIYAW